VSEDESWPGEAPEPADGEVDVAVDEAIDAEAGEVDEADDEDTGDG
jgi:hypothetical protein